MRKSSIFAAVLASGALALGSLCLSSATAFASSSASQSGVMNGTTHSDPSTQGPVLVGPAPVPLPSNCPAFLSSDPWVLSFTGGNSVSHGTMNKNGDWGGSTAEGPAVLSSSDGTPQYTGHLTEWGGGGQNSDPGGPPANQSEDGFTLNFSGTGPAGSLSIHVDQHSTTNNAGAPTANTFNVTVTCG
jgi:hypothetical protein